MALVYIGPLIISCDCVKHSQHQLTPPMLLILLFIRSFHALSEASSIHKLDRWTLPLEHIDVPLREITPEPGQGRRGLSNKLDQIVLRKRQSAIGIKVIVFCEDVQWTNNA